MKIHSYDGENLIVSFSSDRNKKNVDEYERVNFQPALSFPDITDPEEIIKRIAFYGIHHCENEIRREKAKNNKEFEEFYKSKVNKVLEFDIPQLRDEQHKKIHSSEKKEDDEIINNIIIV